jgi:hypothetical protein
MVNIPVLKDSVLWKAVFPETIGRVEGGPAGWLTTARPKRMTR